MIHRLIDKLTERLTQKQAILLLATYEKHGLEWAKRAEVIEGILCFAASDTKCVQIATCRLENDGFMESEIRADSTYGRSKWVRVTEAGRKFLNGCYKHAQGKGVASCIR